MNLTDATLPPKKAPTYHAPGTYSATCPHCVRLRRRRRRYLAACAVGVVGAFLMVLALVLKAAPPAGAGTPLPTRRQPGVTSL